MSWRDRADHPHSFADRERQVEVKAQAAHDLRQCEVVLIGARGSGKAQRTLTQHIMVHGIPVEKTRLAKTLRRVLDRSLVRDFLRLKLKPGSPNYRAGLIVTVALAQHAPSQSLKTLKEEGLQ